MSVPIDENCNFAFLNFFGGLRSNVLFSS